MSRHKVRPHEVNVVLVYGDCRRALPVGWTEVLSSVSTFVTNCGDNHLYHTAIVSALVGSIGIDIDSPAHQRLLQAGFKVVSGKAIAQAFQSRITSII